MAFLSDFLSKPVTDPDGSVVGSLEDIIASIRPDFHHPLVAAVVVRRQGEEILVPYHDVTVLTAVSAALARPLSQIEGYKQTEQDFYLRRDVLDKQIIDTDDVRVVRVNDIELVRLDGSIYASNVDVGALGLLRRAGLANIATKAASIFRQSIPQNFISWDDVELLSDVQRMRLKVPSQKLTDLHPADLANIISDMNRLQTNTFLEQLDLEQLADTLEEVEEDFQVSLVEGMSDEKVADVLEEMAPDEAADLLAELPKARSEKLLELMEDEEGEDVRKLLAFPDDSAGGIMTTEYVAITSNLSAEQTIAYLRENADEAEQIFYVYVTDPEGHLEGVFSLSDLIMAKPEAIVKDFMHRRVVTVEPLDDQNHVAQMVARYNLLAIPVVDEKNVLQGIVTADDALDKIIPTAWKKRLPRYFR